MLVFKQNDGITKGKNVQGEERFWHSYKNFNNGKQTQGLFQQKLISSPSNDLNQYTSEFEENVA